MTPIPTKGHKFISVEQIMEEDFKDSHKINREK